MMLLSLTSTGLSLSLNDPPPVLGAGAASTMASDVFVSEMKKRELLSGVKGGRRGMPSFEHQRRTAALGAHLSEPQWQLQLRHRGDRAVTSNCRQILFAASLSILLLS
jgi:hypothetical protein